MKKLLRLLTGKADDEEGETRAEVLPFLSPKEALILQFLVSHGESYGLGLVDASNGELKRGTVYVTLNRMEEKGYIKSRKDPNAPGGGPAKRMYQATGYGQRALSAWEGLAMAPEVAR